MGIGNGRDATGTRARTLKPMGDRERANPPARCRIRRDVEPTPNQAPRLLFMPPVWTRASFWLPLGQVAVPQTGEMPKPDPHDDFAA